MFISCCNYALGNQAKLCLGNQAKICLGNLAKLCLGNLAGHVETSQGQFHGVDIQFQTCACVTWGQRYIRKLEARFHFKKGDFEVLADGSRIMH